MHVGYHAVHPDVSLNFQINRWFSWVGEPGMLDEMRTVAPRIATYADWQREFAALAQHALTEEHWLRAAYYLRITCVLPSSFCRPVTRNASRCASSFCS